MSAVVSLVKDVVGGVVEAVGDVVEGVVDVVKDVGSAIDDYVIQPILDDPLTAIATMAGAAFLGPAIAPMLGTGLGAATGYVATGLGAAAGNTAAGLAQGEDFDEALKGGLIAGVAAGATSAGFDWMTDAGAFAPDAGAAGAGTPDIGSDIGADLSAPEVYAPSEVGVDIDAFGNAIDPMNNPYATYSDVAVSSPVPPQPSIVGTELPALDAGVSAPTVPGADPLGDFINNLPGVNEPFTTLPDVSAPAVDYSLTGGPSTPTIPEVSGIDLFEGVEFPSTSGLKVPSIGPDTPLTTDILGNVDYSLTAGMNLPQPGLQLPSSPGLGSMGGGQGLTVEVAGLPEFTYADGTTDIWTGANGNIYGAEVPGGTLGELGVTQAPPVMTGSTTAGGTTAAGPGRTLLDSLTMDNLTSLDGLGTIGGNVIDFVQANPLTTVGGLMVLDGITGGPPGGPGSQPNPGGTRDENFTRRMELYNYLRDRQEYMDDLNRYGQTGGEHEFFTNTRFVPVPIETTPTGAKTGGLIQLKQKYEQGGMAQQMPRQMDPRMMAMMQQRRGGGMPQGRPPMPQGRPPMPQGGLAQAGMAPGMGQGRMPPAGMGQGQMPNIPQGMSQNPGQGMQRPQRMNRNPRTSYYQYGTPPTEGGQAQPPMMNRGGALNMVRSYNMGGGADGRSDDVDALLSDGEYVFDAETVAMLGNGSSEAGARRLEEMRKQVRMHKGQNLAKGNISPDAKSPLEYLKG